MFEIQKDGSISKIGSIKESTTSGGDATSGGGASVWLWFFFFVAVIVAIVLGVKYNNAQGEATRYEGMYNDAHEYSDKYYELRSQYDDIRSEYSDFKSSLRDFPMVISNIEVANVYNDGSFQTSYGNTIYSWYTMFLKPRIRYIGINTGQITLKVRLYNAYGNLTRGTSSPSDCTYETSIYVNSGSNLYESFLGWGGYDQGFWPAGNYRYEFWYGNKCLGVKHFTVY